MKRFSGGQGIISAYSNFFIVLHLDVFAIALSIYFSIISGELERIQICSGLFHI